VEVETRSGKVTKPVAFASFAILAICILPASAASGRGIRKGNINIDATTSDVQFCTADYDELGLDSAVTTAPYVFSGKMTGALRENPAEVHLFTDQGALGNTAFGCQSAYAAICLPGDPSE
jgi:hypothetical protein